MEKLNRYILLFVLLTLPSCSDLIEYSPYDADFSAKNLNLFYTENINTAELQESDTLSFVFLSDPHFYYDKLASAVKSINTRSGISFVAIGGDVTDSGLAREYEYYWKQVRKLRYPFVTVIGNHDYLSNGAISFKRMFGESNFSFTCGQYKFIAFNSVVWENNNKSPDFDWLEKEVEKGDQNMVILSHIPPWGDQFTEEFRSRYYDIVSNRQVILNAHGHEHRFRDTLVNNTRYLVTEAAFENEYYIVHLIGNKVEIETVKF